MNKILLKFEQIFNITSDSSLADVLEIVEAFFILKLKKKEENS